MIAPLAWRLALAMAAFGFTFVILGGMLGASLGFMAETDLGSSLIVVSVMVLVNGGLRTARAYLSSRARTTVGEMRQEHPHDELRKPGQH
jgi:hypothetical protein